MCSLAPARTYVAYGKIYIERAAAATGIIGTGCVFFLETERGEQQDMTEDHRIRSSRRSLGDYRRDHRPTLTKYVGEERKGETKRTGWLARILESRDSRPIIS